MIFIGIDPGKLGAIVALDETGKVLLAEMCPLIGTEVDDAGMWQLVARVDAMDDAGQVIAGLEKGQVRPGEANRASFSFGMNIGLWRMALTGHQSGWRFINAKRWQDLTFQGETRPKDKKERKEMIARLAIRRWPELYEILKIKARQGMADAVWIAEHVRLEHLAERPK